MIRLGSGSDQPKIPRMTRVLQDCLTERSLTFLQRYCTFQRNEPCSLPVTVIILKKRIFFCYTSEKSCEYNCNRVSWLRSCCSMNILNDFHVTVLSHFKLLLRLSMIQGVLQCNEGFILSIHSDRYAETDVILLYTFGSIFTLLSCTHMDWSRNKLAKYRYEYKQ
jgi:hypothetical protein